jgi:hypothetical protein
MLLPAGVSHSPMTYMANGKEYIIELLRNPSISNSEAHIDDVFRAPSNQ